MHLMSPAPHLQAEPELKLFYKETIEDNSRFFNSPDDVPRFAISLGIGTILEAKKILLIANGIKKADVCAKFVEGPVTSMITASALQLHSNVTIVLDKEAASMLTRTEYYDWIRNNKHLVQKMIGS